MSSFGFSRNINEVFSIYFQGSLNKGSTNLLYNKKELQEGFVKAKYIIGDYNISTFLYHNFNYDSIVDFPLKKTTYDIGNININNTFFSLNYFSGYYNNSNYFFKKHILSAHYLPLTQGKSNLDIFSEFEYLENNNQKKFYSVGLNYRLEIFPLSQIFIKGKVKNDSTFMFETSFLHRPDAKRAIYFSMFWKRFSYITENIDLSLKTPYEWKRIYIGTKYYSSKLKFDVSAGLSFEEIDYDTLLHKRDTIPTYIIGGANINYNINDNLTLYFNLYKNINYKSYIFISHKSFYFKDDLSLEFIPGLMFEDKDNYYPQLLIKANILSLQAHWRVSYFDDNYVYDYGLFWKLIN